MMAIYSAGSLWRLLSEKPSALPSGLAGPAQWPLHIWQSTGAMSQGLGLVSWPGSGQRPGWPRWDSSDGWDMGLVFPLAGGSSMKSMYSPDFIRSIRRHGIAARPSLTWTRVGCACRGAWGDTPVCLNLCLEMLSDPLLPAPLQSAEVVSHLWGKQNIIIASLILALTLPPA